MHGGTDRGVSDFPPVVSDFPPVIHSSRLDPQQQFADESTGNWLARPPGCGMSPCRWIMSHIRTAMRAPRGVRVLALAPRPLKAITAKHATR